MRFPGLGKPITFTRLSKIGGIKKELAADTTEPNATRVLTPSISISTSSKRLS